MSKDDYRKGQRTRNWCFIVYPDSAPADWRSLLDATMVPWIESPHHDADENADGDQKKPHWHVMMMFDSTKTYAQAHEISCTVNATIPQKVASPKGLVRYMIHMDNPEKAQYDRDSIIGHNGADIDSYFAMSASTRYALIGEMQTWVTDNLITELYMLRSYAQHHRHDWHQLLCDNSNNVMDTYIRSARSHLRELSSAGMPTVLMTFENK
jgi:hypothetical protein